MRQWCIDATYATTKQHDYSISKDTHYGNGHVHQKYWYNNTMNDVYVYTIHA